MSFRKKCTLILFILFGFIANARAQDKTSLLGYYTGNAKAFGSLSQYQSFMGLAKDSVIISENLYDNGQYYGTIKRGTWTLKDKKITIVCSNGETITATIEYYKNEETENYGDTSLGRQMFSAVDRRFFVKIGDIYYTPMAIINP